jgi:hypothetical protein
VTFLWRAAKVLVAGGTQAGKTAPLAWKARF